MVICGSLCYGIPLGTLRVYELLKRQNPVSYNMKSFYQITELQNGKGWKGSLYVVAGLTSLLKLDHPKAHGTGLHPVLEEILQ